MKNVTEWLLILGLLLVPSPMGAQDITRGQLLYYKFSEGSGTTVADQSGNGVTASFINAPLWTNGFQDRALYFASNTARPGVLCTVDAGIMRQGGEDSNWTVSCYIKTGEYQLRASENYIWARVGSHAGLDLQSNGSTTILKLCHRVSSSATTNLSITTNLMNNTWYHTLVTYSNRTFTLFLNGVSLGQRSISPTDSNWPFSSNLYLGWVNGGAYGFTGAIDEFRVYSRALSASDISALLTPSISITNLTNGQMISPGTAFAGSCSDSPAWACLIISNAGGPEVTNMPVTLTSGTSWTANPSLPVGSYTANLSISNSNSLGSTSPSTSFQIAYVSTLTVRTLDQAGSPVSGGILTASFSPVKTNDVNGEVSYPGLLLGQSLVLTNLAPTYYGRPAVVTQFTMPATHTLMVWSVDASWPAASAAAVSNGLILRWDMDEGFGSALSDGAGTGIGGTAVNTPLWTNGYFGRALSFPSNASRPYAQGTVDAGILRQGSEDSNWTVSCWINTGEWPARAVENYIWSRQGSHGGLEMQSNAGSTALCFRYRLSSGSSTNIVLTTNLVHGLWYHTLVTCSNRKFTLYLNGVSQGQNGISPTDLCHNFSTSIYLGWTAGSPFGFSGSVDEFRMYNRALSLPEIVALASPRAEVTNLAPSGLIVSGDTVRGTITSAPSFARIFITNTAGTWSTNLPLSLSEPLSWSVSPILPLGTYTGALVVSNSNTYSGGMKFSFEVTTYAPLTVRSLYLNGNPVVGGRILGPSTTAFGGLRTNDGFGEAIFPNMAFGHTIGLTNFRGPGQGGSPTVTNFTMPATAATLIWILDDHPQSTGSASATNLSARSDCAAFFPHQTTHFTLSVPSATQNTVQVNLVAMPLTGGRRVTLYQGTVSPGDPYIRIPSTDIRRNLAMGTWILEAQYPRSDTDITQTRMERRFLFIGN